MADNLYNNINQLLCFRNLVVGLGTTFFPFTQEFLFRFRDFSLTLIRSNGAPQKTPIRIDHDAFIAGNDSFFFCSVKIVYPFLALFYFDNGELIVSCFQGARAKVSIFVSSGADESGSSLIPFGKYLPKL